MIATSDYELVTESAGLVDRSDRAKFLVRGGEAADFLQGQVSNDVEALAPGHGCYATVLSHKGKLRTDLRILRGEDWFWLDTESIGHAVLEHMLRTYSLGRSDRSRRRCSWRAKASNADSIWRIHDGTQTAPCSITPMRRSGNRSSTPSKISVARVWAGGPGMPM